MCPLINHDLLHQILSWLQISHLLSFLSPFTLLTFTSLSLSLSIPPSLPPPLVDDPKSPSDRNPFFSQAMKINHYFFSSAPLEMALLYESCHSRFFPLFSRFSIERKSRNRSPEFKSFCRILSLFCLVLKRLIVFGPLSADVFRTFQYVSRDLFSGERRNDQWAS